MSTIQIKRIYEPALDTDGFRILVDRLWPRGLKKERARIDLWARAVAPSPELRQWFGHDSTRFAEFRQRYWAELSDDAVHQHALDTIREYMGQPTVTLLYAAQDTVRNNAIVLLDYLRASQSMRLRP